MNKYDLMMKVSGHKFPNQYRWHARYLLLYQYRDGYIAYATDSAYLYDDACSQFISLKNLKELISVIKRNGHYVKADDLVIY